MSFLALDLGEKRIGIAISRSGLIAEPLLTLDNSQDFISRLKDICQEEEVKKIIVGLPKSLSGESNEQIRKTKETAKKIKRELKMPIEFVDESFTSKMAEERFGRERIDEEAAVIILQDYLDKT